MYYFVRRKWCDLPELASGAGSAMPTVIGCGNADRCDDGGGVFVAQVLQAHLRLVGESDSIHRIRETQSTA